MHTAYSSSYYMISKNISNKYVVLIVIYPCWMVSGSVPSNTNNKLYYVTTLQQIDFENNARIRNQQFNRK